MEHDPPPLTFSVVDDLGFAAERRRLGQLPAKTTFSARDLGPAMEFLHLQRGGRLPGELNCVDFSELGLAADNLRRIVDEGGWIAGLQGGAMRLLDEPNGAAWTGFAMGAKRAAQGAGLSTEWAAQMIAALGEMEDNIRWHSRAIGTGLVVYRARPGTFEFVVHDRGVGVLSTLREAAEFSAVNDHGEALRLTLTEGASRFGPGSSRGFGFRPLFVGLANRKADLRFRSGSAAMTINGRNPELVQAQISTKPQIDGFFVSVSCTV